MRNLYSNADLIRTDIQAAMELPGQEEVDVKEESAWSELEILEAAGACSRNEVEALMYELHNSVRNLGQATLKAS